jgi:hypothetical protein
MRGTTVSLSGSPDFALDLQTLDRAAIRPCQQHFFAQEAVREELLDLGYCGNHAEVVFYPKVILDLPAIVLVRLAAAYC